MGKRGTHTGIRWGKPLGKRPLERLKKRWEDNCKVDVREICREGGSGWNWLRIVSNGRLWY
jgi:hypothetical protein